MVGWKVERREVVPFGLGFRTERDRESQLAKNSFDLLDHERHRMLGAQPLAARWHGEIDVPSRDAGGVELAASLLEGRVELRLDGVDQGPGFAQLSGGQRRQLLEQLRQAPRFSAEQG